MKKGDFWMVHNLKNNRFKLREMKEEDWIDIHIYASQPIVCQHQPWGPNSEEETQKFVEQVLLDAKKETRSRFTFAVVEREKE